MMRSLYSGISGLKNHQTRMDVIANNISNVNTVGFKASRTIFQDIYSQTSKGATAPGATTGGSNPMQIGLGVKMATIDVLHTPAATQRTDNPLDLAIEGDGYFVIKLENPAAGSALNPTAYYTRAGNFYIDAAGNLVSGGGGLIQGVQVTPPTIPLTAGGTPTNATTHGITGVSLKPSNLTTSLDGEAITGGVALSGNETGAIFTLTVGTDAFTSDSVDLTNLASGGITLTNAAGDTITLNLSGSYISDAPLTANFGALTTDLATVTGTVSGGLTPNGIAPKIPNGATANDLTSITGLLDYKDISIDDYGVVWGLAVSGSTTNRVAIAQVAIGTFINPAGLQKEGNSLYSASQNSGIPVFSAAQDTAAGAGKINTGGLEMSNVDLSTEFTDMIVTQRGFQANSRIITVSDTLLEELVNLKR